MLSRTASSMPTSGTIFELNSLDSILPVLHAQHNLTSDKTAELRSRIDTLEHRLVTDTHAFLLETSGLNPLAAAGPGPDSGASPAFQPDALAAVSERLDAFLPSAVMDAEARLGGLKSRQRVNEIVKEVSWPCSRQP